MVAARRALTGLSRVYFSCHVVVRTPNAMIYVPSFPNLAIQVELRFTRYENPPLMNCIAFSTLISVGLSSK